MPPRTVRVALLLCDTPNHDVLVESGTYHDIYKHWLSRSLASYPEPSLAADIHLVVDSFDATTSHFPPRQQLQYGAAHAYDCVMLTGSKHTAYDNTNPFIPPLVAFIADIASASHTQHIKLVGVCFGHQIISIALGGTCQPGHNGWEVGVYGCELTDQGKYWWTGDVPGQGGNDKVYLEQMASALVSRPSTDHPPQHKDHVPSVPPDCTLLARSAKYPVHSFLKLHPASTQARPLAQVLTVQGHPEFTPSIVRHIINARAALGVFDHDAVHEAQRRAGGRDGTGGEGFGRVGWAVWRVLLQHLPPS